MSLTLLVGPSGVGKTSIWTHLLEKENVKPFMTHTSREMRESEKQLDSKIQYHFHSKEEFKEMIEKGKFFEWVNFNGNYYGTVKEDIENAINDENTHYVAVVDIRGALDIKAKYPKALSVFFLMSNMEELRDRLKERKSREEDIEDRLNIAETFEIPNAHKLDHIVMNDVLEETVEKVYELINKNTV